MVDKDIRDKPWRKIDKGSSICWRNRRIVKWEMNGIGHTKLLRDFFILFGYILLGQYFLLL